MFFPRQHPRRRPHLSLRWRLPPSLHGRLLPNSLLQQTLLRWCALPGSLRVRVAAPLVQKAEASQNPDRARAGRVNRVLTARWWALSSALFAQRVASVTCLRLPQPRVAPCVPRAKVSELRVLAPAYNAKPAGSATRPAWQSALPAPRDAAALAKKVPSASPCVCRATASYMRVLSARKVRHGLCSHHLVLSWTGESLMRRPFAPKDFSVRGVLRGHVPQEARVGKMDKRCRKPVPVASFVHWPMCPTRLAQLWKWRARRHAVAKQHAKTGECSLVTLCLVPRAVKSYTKLSFLKSARAGGD